MRTLVGVALVLVSAGSASSALAQAAAGSLEIESDLGVSLRAEVDLGSAAEPDDDDDVRRAEYSPAHPLSIGVRSGVWAQRSLEPGVGAHVRWRPIQWFGIELSTDHFFAVNAPGVRRDHLVSADLFLSVIGDRRFFLAPTLGGAVNLRATRAETQAEETLQPLIGGNAGAMGEIYVVDGLAASVAAKAGFFAGGAGEVALSEDAHLAGEVFVEPVGLVTLGMSYAF